MTAERLHRARQTLLRRQTSLHVFLEQVHKPHNLAAIMRTCDAVGVGQVQGVWPDPSLRRNAASAAGSSQWVGMTMHDSLETGLGQLKQQGVTVYAAHFSEQAQDFREVDFTQPSAILLGTEKHGVSCEAAAQVDGHIIIPMLGMVTSLNVSVAAALILYEAQRQRMQAGMYEQPHLPPEQVERQLFEWLQPKIAAHCQRHGLAYPSLDDEGDCVWDELR